MTIKNYSHTLTLSFTETEDLTEDLSSLTCLNYEKFHDMERADKISFLPWKENHHKKNNDEEIIKYFIFLIKKDSSSLNDSILPPQHDTVYDLSKKVRSFIDKEYEILSSFLKEEIISEELQGKYGPTFYNLIRMIPIILSLKEVNIKIDYFVDYKKEALGIMIFGNGTIKITAAKIDVFEFVLSKVKNKKFTNSRGFIRVPKEIKVPYDIKNIIRIVTK